MEVVIGQRVAIRTGYGLQGGYTVTKISPAGQITVERGRSKHRFTPEGYQIGGSDFYPRPWLVIYPVRRKP